MHLQCFVCNYKFGTPHTLLFQYKIEHKDKVSKCACGNQTKSGNCAEEISSKLRGTGSKCSSSNLRSSFTDSSQSSIFSSNPNSDSNSNLRSSWGTKGEAPFTDSNLQSNWGTMGETMDGVRSLLTIYKQNLI